MNEQAQVYSTWDPNESYQQYTILETQGDYEERIQDGIEHWLEARRLNKVLHIQ